jgi:hypothetical protein
MVLVAEFDQRGGWAEWGVNSCAHWLSRRCSIGLGTARDHVRVARRLRELPLVRASFATGELSYSKVRAIARVATPEIRIIERDGRPLSVGRRKRTIPPALRRALAARDQGCRFPGCTHQRFLHAHHIHHWARGGPTVLENLVHLCSHHHRLVHEGGFCVERAGPHSIRFRRPDGRPIPAAGPRTPATGPVLEAQELPIDEYTCMPRSAGDRLDYGIAVEVLLAEALAEPQ